MRRGADKYHLQEDVNGYCKLTAAVHTGNSHRILRIYLVRGGILRAELQLMILGKGKALQSMSTHSWAHQALRVNSKLSISQRVLIQLWGTWKKTKTSKCVKDIYRGKGDEVRRNVRRWQRWWGKRTKQRCTSVKLLKNKIHLKV